MCRGLRAWMVALAVCGGSFALFAAREDVHFEQVGGYSWLYLETTEGADFCNPFFPDYAAVVPRPEGAVSVPGTLGGLPTVSVGDYAFFGRSNVTSVVIPTTVTNIGQSAFYSCRNLTSVNLPEGLKSIGSGAFLGCEKLTDLHIPDSVVEIGGWAFMGCPGLADKDGFTVIRGMLYGYYGDNAAVTVPAGVTGIDDYALGANSTIVTVCVPGSVKRIGCLAMALCDNLLSVKVGEGVESIGFDAFSGCGRLSKVELPESLRSYELSTLFDGENRVEFTFMGPPPDDLDAMSVNRAIVFYNPKYADEWEAWLADNPTVEAGPLVVDGDPAAPADGLVSNCFSIVEYGEDCTHLVCDLPMFAGMDFVLDRTEVNKEPKWRFGPHHTKGWSYSAVVMPGDMISYLNFQGEQEFVDLNPKGDMYCAFAWNDPAPMGQTHDYLGWFRLREVDGKITIVSCAVETRRGYRMVVDPDEPVDWLTWTDPDNLITWYYKVYGDVCGIGCGRVGMAGAKFPGNIGGMGQVAIPEKIKGLPVVKIESYAFFGCDIGELHVPSSVTNVAAYAFKDGRVSAMYFEGDAPTVEDGGFDGLDGGCEVYPTIDAGGWPNDIIWHGLQLAYKYEHIDRKDEFERERVDAEGVRWHDVVEYTEWIYRNPFKSDTGWCLFEEVYCETNVFSRLADVSEETRFQSQYCVVDSDVEYYDLRLKKSERSVIENANWQADGASLWSHTTINRNYDKGRIANSQQQISEEDGRGFWRETDVGVEWSYDKDGNVDYREEKKTVSGSDGFRWHSIADDYYGGVLYSSSSTSGESLASYKGETTVMGPEEVRDVSAKSEEDALGMVAYWNYMVVEGGAALPVPMDVYMGYFKATATQVGEDMWRVAYDVDPEAVGLSESVADIGPQLGAIASGEAKTITISAKPGLYYGIATAESPAGPFVCPRLTYAWGDTVTLPAPDPKSGLFMRVVVGAKD